AEGGEPCEGLRESRAGDDVRDADRAGEERSVVHPAGEGLFHEPLHLVGELGRPPGPAHCIKTFPGAAGASVSADSLHSFAVVPSHDGLCGVPTPFLSVTSLGRGSRFRYQMLARPADDDFGASISAWMSVSERKLA